MMVNFTNVKFQLQKYYLFPNWRLTAVIFRISNIVVLLRWPLFAPAFAVEAAVVDGFGEVLDGDLVAVG